jgi:diguanylate cyclase (GGDEF)-like protein/PAS domain S-box-containing protein
MARVLVVDDNVANRELTVTLLRHHGHEPLQAVDGLDALGVVKRESPDLVISDILMPTMDGYELVRRLRADPQHWQTRVIFCTAIYREREAHNLALRCGVSDVLVKPFESEDLVRVVDHALSAAAEPRGLAPDFADQHHRLLTGKLSEQTQALQAALARLAALHDLNLRLSSERDNDVLLADVCRGARELLGARFAVIAVRDKYGAQDIRCAHSGIDSADKPLPCPSLDRGVCGSVMSERRARRLVNPSGDPAAVGLGPYYPRLETALIAPVVSLTHVYGWICLADKVGAAQFTEDDERALSILAAQVGRIYESGSLYALVQRHARQLEIQIAERNRATEEQRESDLRFRQLAENIDDAFWICTADYRKILYLSPAFEQIWGRSREEMYASPITWPRMVHPEDRAAVYGELMRRAGDILPYSLEYRIVRPDGSFRWIADRAFPIRDAAGHSYRVAGVARDITERHAQHDTIKRLTRLYAVLSGVNSMIMRMRNREALFHEACRIAVMEGEFDFALIGTIDPETQEGTIVASSGDDESVEQQRVIIPLTARPDHPHSHLPSSVAARTGTIVVCNDLLDASNAPDMREFAQQHAYRSLAAIPIMIAERPVAVMSMAAKRPNVFEPSVTSLLQEMAADIAFGLQFIEKEERLAYLAVYDVLTGLPNHTLFLDRLGQIIRSARTAASVVAVILVDIDRFKHINDTYGRHVGDTVLRKVAERFTAALPQSCCVGRVSADSFAIAAGDLTRSDNAATLLIDRLRGAMNEPISIDEHHVNVSFRAGVALYPDDGGEAVALFEHAEAALKLAQSSGNVFAFYSAEINRAVIERVALEARLRRAIELEQFVLHYQPQVDAEARRIVGLEALLRWNDPDIGLVMPDRFIPVLEESGLILRVGFAVLQMALADHRDWRRRGLNPPRIAVNVSAMQLREPGFAASIAELVGSGGGDAGALELEITESMLMNDLENSSRTLRTISESGVRIAIDDFGTGYSSLRYLAKLPITTVKIDRSFIAAMVDDADSMTIVSTIISLAHSLKLSVCAEGVESDDQFRYLSLLRCDDMQGYLFSRPVPAADVARLLDRAAL